MSISQQITLNKDNNFQPTPEYSGVTPGFEVDSPVYDPEKSNYKPPISKKKSKHTGLYILQIITRKINIPFNIIGNNIKQVLQKKLELELEGKCSKEGFIKTNSVRVINYSAGIIDGDTVLFHVVLECLICHPVEGMKFKINVSSITKAGIRGFTKEEISPVDVFISRDHHYSNKYFNTVKINDDINVRVIGIRYEINDEKISVLAELLRPQSSKKKSTTTKPKIIFEIED